jgi:histidine decarboxylase
MDSRLIADIAENIRRSDWYDIGYPAATDLPLDDLAAVFTRLRLTNIGDPWDKGTIRHNTKQVEQQVVETVADLIEAPASRWGYVTTASSEAIEYALVEAVTRWQDVVVYTSQAAHRCVSKNAWKLRLPLVTIRAGEHGHLDLGDLRSELGKRRHLPAAIIATVGTTWAEAIDDLPGIVEICDDLAIDRLRLHVDAALSGIPLALMAPERRPPATFGDVPRITSWSTSGNKFLAARQPCGILVCAAPPLSRDRVAYTGSLDTTLGFSRSGHMPLVLWHQMTRLTLEQHRDRADSARQLAAYTHERFQQIGWPTRRNPSAYTVVFRRPPKRVCSRWGLAYQGDWARLITVPGVVPEQVDELLFDMQVAMAITGSESPEPEPAASPSVAGPI